MKALSLFSGAGGMDIGVLQAGFEILACIELDKNACNTLRAAITREQRHTQVIQKDIRQINPQELMNLCGLEYGKLDLLFGGPPCQAFSAIGKQQALADERGLLLFEMIRFADILKPRFIMIEQVKGLLSIKDEEGIRGGIFNNFLNNLKNLGYVIQWQLIQAADYGIPQLRERIFIVAHLPEWHFEFPNPTHRAPENTDLFNRHLPIYNTVGEALHNLRSPSPKDKLDPPEDSHMDVSTEGDKRRIHGVPEGAWLSSQTHLPAEQICGLTKKDTTKFRRLSRKMPSLTLRCGEIFFHPTEDRILTPREYMRIHGYPDDYKLLGPIRSRSGRVRELDQHRLVANSVPPIVAKAIAKEIVRSLHCQPSTRFLDTHSKINLPKHNNIVSRQNVLS